MIAENNMEDIEIAIDSTGISIYKQHTARKIALTENIVAMSKRENCT
ncbi:hypothetical protein WPAU_1019 [Wolbachia endosymbiont of Drosophila simulans wAu]|nr:hypothetical protein WPAU_1019 [Wolbachia endosymbiont of Drosophila simulans wAu]